MRKTLLRKISLKQASELQKRRKVKAELIRMYGYKCSVCGGLPDFKDGRGELHLSHINRLSSGHKTGVTSVENCRLECRACHNLHHGILER